MPYCVGGLIRLVLFLCQLYSCVVDGNELLKTLIFFGQLLKVHLRSISLYIS